MQRYCEGYMRQIMLITDGGVYDGQEDALKELVSYRGAARTTQVFILGIGHEVNRPLLEAVASA